MKMKRLALALAVLVAPPAAALPIQTNSGFSAYQGQWIVRSQVRLHLRGDDPTAADRRVTEVAVPTTLIYGVTPRLTAMATVPYIQRDMDLTTSSGRVRRGDAAIGDMTLMGLYRAYTRDETNARTLRLSLLGGASLATGPDDAADAMGRLPRGLQIGRGATEALIGAAATRWTPRWVLSGDFLLRPGGKDEGYRYGDLLKYNLAYEYAISPRELPEEGLPDFVYALVELNGEVAGRDRFLGSVQGSTGGHVLYVAPGFQYAAPRYAIEASVQIPVVADLNGLQTEPWATFVVSNRFTW